MVGLEGKGERMPDELSGGEQQRVAIARAFVNRPMILIADEPTGNLDPTTSVGIMKLLDRINRTGTTVRDGDPRRRHRRPDAQARHRARRRPRRPRPGPRRLRLPALTGRPRRPTERARHAAALRLLRARPGSAAQHLDDIAVVVTLFVSLTLVGLGVLLNAQADKAEQLGRPAPDHRVPLHATATSKPPAPARPPPRRRPLSTQVIEANPEVADYHFETSEQAYDKVKELYGDGAVEGPNPADHGRGHGGVVLDHPEGPRASSRA